VFSLLHRLETRHCSHFAAERRAGRHCCWAPSPPWPTAANYGTRWDKQTDEQTNGHLRVVSITGNKSVPKIILNNNELIFLNCNQHFANFRPQQSPVMIKLLPYVLLERCICILALEVASPGNRHCAMQLYRHTFVSL